MDKSIYMITIVVIVRNEQNKIEDFLNSLLHAKEINTCEVIFIDGNSTDNTLNILKNNSGKFKNIKIIKCKKYGYSYQRNVGVLRASGEFILFLSADIKVNKNIIIKYKNEINRQKNDCIQGSILYIGKGAIKKAFIDFNKLTDTCNSFSTVNTIVKKEKLINYAFDENVKACEDKIWFFNNIKEITYKIDHTNFIYHYLDDKLTEIGRKLFIENVELYKYFGYKMMKKHNMIYSKVNLLTLFCIFCLFLDLTILIVSKNPILLVLYILCIIIFALFYSSIKKLSFLQLSYIIFFSLCSFLGSLRGSILYEKRK